MSKEQIRETLLRRVKEQGAVDPTKAVADLKGCADESDVRLAIATLVDAHQLTFNPECELVESKS